MGVRVPPLPPSVVEYQAGLAEGRDLYAEDLARFRRGTRQVHLVTLALLAAFALLFLLAASMLFAQEYFR